MNIYDLQYQQLITDILNNGLDKPDRTGIGSRAVFGKSFTVDLGNGFPISTIRKVPFRFAFEETMFFLRGETDTKKLEEKKINIWKGNTSREFLDNRGLHYLSEGSIGTGYSHCWRNFGGTLGNKDGIDQIQEFLITAKNDPNNRRLNITAWNPTQNSGTPLPPCHLYQQYGIFGDSLNSLFLMRSTDTIYGLPLNIMSYALLNVIFAKYLNLSSGTLTFMGGDVHIYSNQLAMAKEMVTRPAMELPTLKIHKNLTTLEDIESLEYSDVELVGYISHPDFKNKPPMAI